MNRLKGSKLSSQVKAAIYIDYITLVDQEKKPITISIERIAADHGVSVSSVQHCVRIGKANDKHNARLDQ